ncbi:MAG: diaminopimelate epimerase [Acutalibacteraceae bacterium]|jgi:diaminopimelate epimerase
MKKYRRITAEGAAVDRYVRVEDGGEKQRIAFTKMHGCANDYVYISCFDQPVRDFSALAVYLSDRHTGIGGDGVIFICPSEVADARMRMFNLDGSEGMMCGNGIRCVAKFVYDSGIARKEVLHIETKSGVRTCRVHLEDGAVSAVTVDMGRAVLAPQEIPVLFDGASVVAAPLEVGGVRYAVTCVSMGNPHCVVFGDDPDTLDLERIGPGFEHFERFPARINTEFIQVLDSRTLKMRVWERGSGETMACGTGACAAVVAACLNGYCRKGEDVRVLLRGGELTVRYTDEGVQMTGGADTVFTGTVEI